MSKKAYNTAYYEANKEKIKAYRKAYNKVNKEKQKSYNEANKDKKKSYNEANKDKIKISRKAWYEANKEKQKSYSKTHYEANKDKIKAYYEANKDKRNNRFKVRLQNDPLFKLSKGIRISINKTLTRHKFTKRSSTAQILGCTWEEFKHHIESQFEPWMNWDNRGGRVADQPNTTWDLDHIIPLASAQTEEDIIRLNHYTNLRPLCSHYNRFVKRDNHPQ